MTGTRRLVPGRQTPAVAVGAPADLIAVRAADAARGDRGWVRLDRLRLRFGHPIGEIQS